MAIGSKSQAGFTYIGLLLFVAISGIGLAIAAQVWHTESQRENEKELLFVGEQYASAIGSYYEATPGGLKQYPARLEDLLQDSRFSLVRRHLRQLYFDPIMKKSEWGLVKEQGKITGVFSLSGSHPLKVKGFPSGYSAFANAESYRDWQFIYNPDSLSNGQQRTDSNNGVESNSSGASATAKLPSNQGTNFTQSPSLPETDYSKKQICLGQRVSDTAACTFYCKLKEGTSNECRTCQASIINRYNVCLLGGSLPPLAD